MFGMRAMSTVREEERKVTTWDRVKDSPVVVLITLPILWVIDTTQGRDGIDMALGMVAVAIWGLISDILEPRPVTPMLVAYGASGILGISLSIAQLASMEKLQNGLFMMEVGALIVSACLSLLTRWRWRQETRQIPCDTASGPNRRR